MTVANNPSRDQYTATSGQTVFPYTFEIFDKGDVVVVQNSTILAEGTNYTVSNVGNNSGGNITFTVGATAGDTITIYRDMAYERTTDYQTSGDFLAAEVNADFDRLWLAVQQNEEVDTRAVRKPITDADSINMELPAAATRSNSYLAFDSAGAVKIVAAGDPEAPNSIARQNFTGNGLTTIYTLASAPSFSGAGAIIFIDGLQQDKDSYTISGTTLTFSEAPPANSNINIVQIKLNNIGETDSDSVSYIPSGSGVVERSVQSKLRESVSVKDFGAVGDGVKDDTASIQSALNSGATKVFFPVGTYKVTSEISVSANSNLSIVGDGARINVVATEIDNVLKITVGAAIDFVTVRGLYIDGNSVAATGLFIEGTANSVSRVTIENNIVENLDNVSTARTTAGIRVDALGVEATRVVGNTVKNVTRTQVNPGTIASIGIRVTEIVHGVVISGNHIENINSPSGDADADGIHIEIPGGLYRPSGGIKK